jgi:hypothetical protein
MRPAVIAADKDLEALDRRVVVDLTVNELRILLGCLRAIEYQMIADDEPYLDPDGFALKVKLQGLYRFALQG